ncbi:MAG TPA: adenylyltransferase/cytidyltransferase family protein [bacterium]|jgi:cytidyltransferase-like protein|nr:adenylyltransferase/cytidyltransferase family protein [bacterium]
MIITSLSAVTEFLKPNAAVLVSGAFDPLHYGHIRYIRAAADYAAARSLPLVVAVAPDGYVQRRHPLLQHQQERMEMIDALRDVAFVVPQESGSLARTIREIRPLSVVKGTDWKAAGLPADELAAIEEVGAGVVWTDVSPVSSSELLHNAFWRFADEWVGRT